MGRGPNRGSFGETSLPEFSRAKLVDREPAGDTDLLCGVGGFRMKKVVLDALESLGFRPRQLKKAFVQRYLVPRGYGEWQPLILTSGPSRMR